LPLTPVFSAADTERLSGCLGRLLPHVRRNGVAITGGVAMQLGIARLGGQQGLRTEVADLDLVAVSLDAVAPGAADEFLVSHYHVVQPGVPKFMIQLVDPVSRLRIDVFPDLVGSVADARDAVVGEQCVPVLPLERVFEHKLLTLSRASRSAPIDPKHVRDTQFLGNLLGRPTPSVDSEAVVTDVYGPDADRSCTRCELSRRPSWPLAPKDRIFELLGWNTAWPTGSRR
jgi:hypothetical protein